jgi:GDP-4-dehydro-6-deoxy-D-mannose reductase
MVGSHMVDFFLQGDFWKLGGSYPVDPNRLYRSGSSDSDAVQVYGLRRWRSDMSNLEMYVRKPNKFPLQFLDVDLIDVVAVRNAVEWANPDFIFHLGAMSYVPSSYENAAATLQTNVGGTLNVLEAVRGIYGKKGTYNGPVVHVCSSCEVYGCVKPEECPIRESQELRAASPYALSKLAADRLANVYWEAHGVRTVITRAFNHTGARRNSAFVESSIAKQIVEIEKGGSVRGRITVGNLESVRTFMHVEDVVAAYWILANYGEFGEAYNVASDESVPVSVRGHIDRMLSVSGLDMGRVDVCTDFRLFRPKDASLFIPYVERDSKFYDLLARYLPSGSKWPLYTNEIYLDLLEYWRERV